MCLDPAAPPQERRSPTSETGQVASYIKIKTRQLIEDLIESISFFLNLM